MKEKKLLDADCLINTVYTITTSHIKWMNILTFSLMGYNFLKYFCVDVMLHCYSSSVLGLSLSSSEKLFRVTHLSPLLYSILTLSIGGFLAFGLGFSEFLLVSRTSSLTLSISGIFKVNLVQQAIFLVHNIWYTLIFLSLLFFLIGSMHFTFGCTCNGRQNEHP